MLVSKEGNGLRYLLSFPQNSGGACNWTMVLWLLADTKKLGMMPNKLDAFEAQGFSSDSTMALRGFADQLLGPSKPPPPQVTLHTPSHPKQMICKWDATPCDSIPLRIWTISARHELA